MTEEHMTLHQDFVSIGQAADALVRDMFLRRFERHLDDASRAFFEGHLTEALSHLDEARGLVGLVSREKKAS